MRKRNVSDASTTLSATSMENGFAFCLILIIISTYVFSKPTFLMFRSPDREGKKKTQAVYRRRDDENHFF